MSQDHKYTRTGKTIKNIHDGTSETFEFINEAKRKSREIQLSNGGLGCGVLQVKK